MGQSIYKKNFSKVRKTIPGINYIRGLGILKKKHRNATIKKLKKIVEQLEEFQITTQYDNHRLKGTLRDYFELHVEPDVLLVYKYDDSNKLYVDLDLYDLLNHDKLDRN